MDTFKYSGNLKKGKPSTFIFLVFLFISTFALGQIKEICNNGIDDDFDGFIDCYDGSCANDPACDGIFLGNDASCSVPPPQFPKFTMSLDFASPNETTNHLSRMAIGDLDRDGMPEFVTMNRYTNKIYILNGNDGSIKKEAIVPFEPRWEVAIANLNNDNCGEIFFIGYLDLPAANNDGIYLFAYDCQLNFLWQTAKRLPDDPINFGLADFDGDGLVELYAKDEIYDAHTGTRIIKTSAPNYTRINGGPVAADIMNDANLELILGLNIYQVNLGNRTADAGSLTLLKSRNEYFVRNEYNATSVADFNLDGYLDVIASGSEAANNKTTTIFYWDVQNDVLKSYRDLTGAYAPNGWVNGTGRVNIADLDGDGKLNASYVSGKYLYALKEDLTLLWRIVINEETSGYTGCTLFDFNGDGQSEIVYRDEQFLYIINGKDGSVYNQKACISRTNREYPIVADVDADGSTELCVTCGFDDALAKANFNNLNYSRYSHIRVFKSAGEPWVPARRVWNQHGYFVVNVNDDLTIPKVLQKHQLVFSTGSCTVGPNRPLNKFLNQSPFLNSEGCPTYASPDLAYSIAPTVVPPVCPDLNYTVSFQITNKGDVGLTGNIPITFYSKNPAKAGAVKLNTITVPIVNLKPNSVFNVTNALVTGNGSDSLYVVLNDAGTTVPTPISLPNTTFFECNYDNIIGVGVKPKPVVVTGLEVSPNEKCSSSNNGAARAFVAVGGVENTTDYDFYWSIGAVAKPIASADFTGPVYSGIAEGTYTIYAIHKTAGCSSDTSQVVINAVQSIVPTVTVNVLSQQTQCSPPNGRLEALVAGGNSGYTFEWFNNAISLGVTTSVASGLVGGNYTVVVSKNGCSVTQIAIVDDNAIDPDITANSTPVVNCQNPNSGTVSAIVSLGGVVQPSTEYDFNWYFYDNASSTRGSQLPLANGTGPDRTGLVAGFYQVVTINKISKCPSLPFVVEVKNQTNVPVVTISQLAPQTSCDPANPNGRLQATVTIGGVVQSASDFTFEWFIGQNTLPANLYTNVSGTNGSIAEKIKGGGQSYTVKATSAFQCFSISDGAVTETLNIPVVTLTPTPNGICDPALVVGSPSAARGSISASITFAGNPVVDFTDYKFDWYDGTKAIGAQRPETSSVLPSLNSGFYTLVVTRTDISCIATNKTAEVLNTTILPVITADAIGSTNCTLALANGQVRVTDVDGAGTSLPYVFAWHPGTDISTPVITGATSPILTKQQGGVGVFFTTQVTNQSNGCQNTATVGLPDNRVIPNIVLAQTPNSICNASLTNPLVNFNGSVAATITNQVGSISDYTFTWYNGQLVTDPVNGTSTNQNLTSLNSGSYTTTTLHPLTGCVSPSVSIDVLNTALIPAITMSAISSTNCDPALKNGKAIVTTIDTNPVPNPTGILSPYAFEWFDGNTPTTLINGATDGILENWQGGIGKFCTVRVTNQSNGCQNTSTVEVPDNQSLPVLTLSATDNKNCSAPFDGTASVNTIIYKGTPEGLGGYSFNWTHGPTTATTTGLNAGTYELRATRVDVGCVSDPVLVDVKNNIYTPVINVAITDQTSCDAAIPNGALSASINETSMGGAVAETTGYIYVWTNDGNPLTPGGPNVGATAVINALPGNLFYTLTVQRSATRCTNTATVFLPERILLPRLELTASNIVDCNTNGFVTARIFIDKNNNGNSTDAVDELTPAEIAAGYSLAWFRGSNTSGTQLSQTGRVLNEVSVGVALPSGNYTAIATNNLTHCTTSDFTSSISSPPPLFEIVPEINKNPSSCGIDEGVVTAKVEIGGVQQPFGNYTFQWFSGNPTNAISSPSPNFYTDPPVQFIAPALNVDQLNISGGPIVGISGSPQLPISPTSGATLYGRPSGTFSVVVQNITSGCKEYKTFYLPYVSEPVIILAKIIPDDCLGDNGAVEVDMTAPNPVNNYKLQIFTGNNPNLGVAIPTSEINPPSGTGNLFGNLASGMYTVVAQEKFGNACFSAPLLIQLIEALPPIVDITGSTANTSCVVSPFSGDGSLQIKVSTNINDPFSAAYSIPPPPTILQKGVAPFVTYSIDVKDAANLAVPGYPTTSTFIDGDVNAIAGLRGETYTITVISSKGCNTTKTFDIPNAPRVADLSGNVNVLPALACDPNLETNAMVEVKNISIPGVVASDNLSDYQFDWFTNVTLSTNILSANGNNNPAIKGGEVLSNMGAPLPSTPVTAGSYWVRSTKVVAGATKGLGCLSTPLKVDIVDQSVKPVGKLTPSANTACDNNSEGSILAEILSPGSMTTPTYNYSWVAPVTSPIANSISNGLPQNFTNLNDGIYSLSYKNNTSGCVGTFQTTISKSATPIVVSNATPVDQFICDFDGSITVGANDIQVGGVVDNNHSRFDFTWSRGDVATIVVGPTQNEDILNVTNLPTIGAGTYFVTVRKRSGIVSGSGCESAPFRVNILDKSVNPTVTLAPLSDTSCDTNFEGSIKVTVTNPGSVASPDYDYSWPVTPVGSPIINGTFLGSIGNFAGLSDGPYSVVVTNKVSKCFTTAQTIVTKLTTPIIVAKASVVDQLICKNDGSISIGSNDIVVGGVVDSDHTRFDFTWSRGAVGTVVVGPTQNEDALTVTNYPTIGADSYFVTVRKRPGILTGSGCVSAPLKVEIKDLSKAPDVTFTSIVPNSSCNEVLKPNGFIEVTATERNSVPGTYSFIWTLNGGALPAITTQSGVSPISQIANARMGSYTVEATNTNTGCKFSQAHVLETNLSLSLPSIVNITPTNPVNCLPQGSAQVVAFTIGGTKTYSNPPDDIDTDFDYEWYKGLFDPANLMVGQQNSLLSNQMPGTYFVRVKNLNTECISATIQTVIDAANIVYPVVSIQQITPQIVCTINTGSGALTGKADGQNDTNPNYEFNWYSNLNLSGTSFASTNAIDKLVAGDYSLQVHNKVTDCRASAIFILPENKLEFQPVLSLSSNPLTECDTNDGSIFARGILFQKNADPSKNYPFTYNYTADLYLGDPPADLSNPEFPNMPTDPNNPAFTNNYVQTTLVNGVYTVRLTDNNTGCFTIDKVSIDDLRKFPKPVVTTVAPVTNCDPANPNGVGRVLVDGSFIGYEFNWYEGDVVSGLPVYTGAEFGKLKVTPQVYTIEAINLVTGCAGNIKTSITNGTVPIPTPQIEILSLVTSCVFNNGALAATVGGNTKDYLFNWYDGSNETPPVDFVGEIYDSLAAGTYAVTATSVLTGCKSPLANKAIAENKEFPEFNFQIQNASCDQPNGFATVFITSTIGIGSIVWLSSNQIVEVGPNLTNVLAGLYTLEITSELGCNTTKDLEILAEIRPRNGISRNGDSQNDYFHIDCIEQFESNNVKIFNRAGTLVYEADGYDNSNIYFDGTSNRGLSLIGKDVPDGTYYFIVDKRNGSKPIAGYLEIVK